VRLGRQHNTAARTHVSPSRQPLKQAPAPVIRSTVPSVGRRACSGSLVETSRRAYPRDRADQQTADQPKSISPAMKCPIAAAAERMHPWKISVPTVLFAPNPKIKISATPNNVPAPPTSGQEENREDPYGNRHRPAASFRFSCRLTNQASTRGLARRIITTPSAATPSQDMRDDAPALSPL